MKDIFIYDVRIKAGDYHMTRLLMLKYPGYKVKMVAPGKIHAIKSKKTDEVKVNNGQNSN